ncbi:MAG: tetratricopeptide repeat protein [Candidatus Melainabacteria bacterium]|nr:tetratricopeptide repeat protein [Candidatus Melainabacteria bacterium]
MANQDQLVQRVLIGTILGASLLVVGVTGWLCIDMQNRNYSQLAKQSVKAKKYAEAEVLFSKAIQQAEANNNLNESADLLTDLGDVYASDQKPSSAAVAYRKALTLVGNVKATDKIDRSSLLTRNLLIKAKLANTLSNLNQLEEANTLYEEIWHADQLALTISDRSKVATDYAQLLRKEHKESEAQAIQTETDASLSGYSMVDLGAQAFDKGDFEQAETFYKILLRSANGPSNFRDQANACSMLGLCALRFGHIDEAENQNRQALSICKKIRREDKKMSSKAMALAILAFCARDKGQSQESKKFLQEACRTDADTAALTLTRTLALLTKTKQLDKKESAFHLCEEAIPYMGSSEKQLALLHILESHAAKSNSVQQLERLRQKERSLMPVKASKELSKTDVLISEAHVYIGEKKYAEAIPLFSKAISYFDQSKNEHLSRSATLELCACLSGLGQTKEARLRLGELISRCEKSPREGFLDEALMSAGTCDRQLGNYALSLSEFVRALPIVEKRQNPSMLADLLFWDLADGYRTAGKDADYESSTRRALALYRKLNDKAGISRAMETLAICLESRKKTTEAQSVWTKLLAFREKQFGAKSLETTQVLFRLGNLARDRKNFKLADDYYTQVLDHLESMDPAKAAQGVPYAKDIVAYRNLQNPTDDLLSKRARAFLSKFVPGTSK